MKVKLTLETRNDSGITTVTQLEGTPSEIREGIGELFSARQADDVRQCFGIKPSSESDASNSQ